ncbi:hypothetical protein DRE_04827 [Drechslerella stenobrocha 248]|uniref:Uncharacterized protein n=1 Tax=Drechslerella stenobrocha 248 TaxID=1043628 RepID=W7HS76_9PEZI|nr:hypothetical protein DRE_04827 [Drechslerella stenobrocha 248]
MVGSPKLPSVSSPKSDGSDCGGATLPPLDSSVGKILGQDLTRNEDVRDGTHTPLAWKEAKRAADSKIITEMPGGKK